MEMIYKNSQKIFTEHDSRGVRFLTFSLFDSLDFLRHGFSTRMGGVSRGYHGSMNISTTRGDSEDAVRENRRRIAGAIGVSPEDFVYARQTHTTHVRVVRKEDRGRQFPETDGLVTGDKGVCLVTFYADCVPLFFVDVKNRVIGLSHSGWRGTVHHMVTRTLETMKEAYGTRAEEVLAAVGPSICMDCYEVSEDVISAFQQAFPREVWGELFYGKENGKYHLNLWRANEWLMEEAGIRKENIAVTNVCTCCNPDVLFSHRVMGEKRGNLSAFLALK